MPPSSTLQLKLLLEEFPEFQYGFGDPTPMFLQYMLSFNGAVETHVKLKHGSGPFKYSFKDMDQSMCLPKKADPTKMVRGFKPPADKAKRAREMLLKDEGAAPFVVIPLLMKNTNLCKNSAKPNESKHVTYALYNRLTHEVERIDMKKYHLNKFRIVLLYRSMQKMLAKLISPFDAQVQFVYEHDTPESVLRKLRTDNLRHAYPFFLVAYLQTRFAHPEWTSDQAKKHLNKMKKSDFLAAWEHFAAFRRGYKHAECAKEDMARNVETGQCIKKTNPMWNERMVDMGSASKDINIHMESALNVKLAPTAPISHIGRARRVWDGVHFVLSKYPYATFVSPMNASGSDVETFGWIWEWQKETKQYTLSVPRGYWTAWKKAMLSPARFLVTLFSIFGEEDGHANTLIYDKHTNEMERFDSNGFNDIESYDLNNADAQIEAQFKKREGSYVARNFKYYTPLDYCPRKMPIFQSKEMETIFGEEKHGTCAVWRLWYIDTRLANPTLSREEVVTYAMKQLNSYGNLKRFIRSYQMYILNHIKANDVPSP